MLECIGKLPVGIVEQQVPRSGRAVIGGHANDARVEQIFSVLTVGEGDSRVTGQHYVGPVATKLVSFTDQGVEANTQIGNTGGSPRAKRLPTCPRTAATNEAVMCVATPPTVLTAIARRKETRFGKTNRTARPRRSCSRSRPHPG